jgi:hypothetical protein
MGAMRALKLNAAHFLAPAFKGPAVNINGHVLTVFARFLEKQNSIAQISPCFQITATRKDVKFLFWIYNLDASSPRTTRTIDFNRIISTVGLG